MLKDEFESEVSMAEDMKGFRMFDILRPDVTNIGIK